MVTQIFDSGDQEIRAWWERYTETRKSADDHHLRVFVRSLRPPPGTHRQRARLGEDIQTLGESGTIDSYELQVMGDEHCLCHHCQELLGGTQMFQTIQELATWRTVDVESCGFRQRTVDCTFTDEEYRILVPPETSIGVYLGGSLTGVFPCTAGEKYYSVEAFLSALVNDKPPADSSVRRNESYRPVPQSRDASRRENRTDSPERRDTLSTASRGHR